MPKSKGTAKIKPSNNTQTVINAADMSVEYDATTAMRTANLERASTNYKTFADVVRPPQRQNNLPNDMIAIRSQVLQHVSTKNKEAIDHAIATFKDSQQFELEKLSRHFENDLCPKMKKALHQQVMQQIKQQNLLDWNDLIKNTIGESCNTHIEASIIGKIEAAIVKEREEQRAVLIHDIHCIADGKVGKAIAAEKKRSEKSMWGMIRKNLGESVRPMIDDVMMLEQQCRTGALKPVIASIKSLDERLKALGNLISEISDSVTRTLVKVDEVTKEGVAKMRTTTLEDLAHLETGLVDKIDEIQAALGIQIDTTTNVWATVKKLQSQAEGLTWREGSSLDDGAARDDDLISFGDDTTLAMSSQSSSPQHPEALLDLDPFTEDKAPERLAKAVTVLTSIADGDLLGLDTSHETVEPGEILEGEDILEAIKKPSVSKNAELADQHEPQLAKLPKPVKNTSQVWTDSETISRSKDPANCSVVYLVDRGGNCHRQFLAPAL